MIYYISDLHLNDKRILVLCNRPFVNTDEYFKYMLEQWNKKINKKDTIYILGDLFSPNNIATDELKLISKLNGQKHLIVGNHDETIVNQLKKTNVFKTIQHLKTIKDNGRLVCLCHYPIMDWNEFNNGSHHIYGHIHNKTSKNGKCYKQIKEYFKDKLAFNASVDVVSYIPRTLDELIKLKRNGVKHETIN